MNDTFSMKAWTSEQWSHTVWRQSLARDWLREEPTLATAAFLQWRKINISLTVADRWEIDWISSGSQISLSFFSLLKGWIPKQMCLEGTGHQVEGWKLGCGLVLGLNLEVRGQLKVRVMARLRLRWGQSVQSPAGHCLSGHCLPLCPVN